MRRYQIPLTSSLVEVRRIRIVRTVFVTSFLWDLPGRKLDSAVARAILADWKLSGIVTLQSGRPFTI